MSSPAPAGPRVPVAVDQATSNYDWRTMNTKRLPLSLADSLGRVTARVLEPVEDTHRAVANRWFGLVGSLGLPIRLIHDAISGLVYSSIRLGGRAVGMGLEASNALRPSTTDSLGALVDGLWGDPPDPRTSMNIRDPDGRLVDSPWDAGAPTGRLVVFVHGLTATERCWTGTAAAPGLADLVADEPALTPLLVRYNSGLRVSMNGSLLAGLLEEILRNWPVPVESVALVGHSMGGLVIRSACETARTSEQRWIDEVTDVVTLGSPHLGVPLEKFVGKVAWGLELAPETRPFADFLNRRSAGIKDLRHGSIVDEGSAPQGGRPEPPVRIDLPSAIRHHFVAGAVTADPHHPAGVALGDLLVRTGSGVGGSKLRPTSAIMIGGVRHFDLPREPEITERVMGWLTS